MYASVYCYPDRCASKIEQPGDNGKVLDIACLEIAGYLGHTADDDEAGADSLMRVFMHTYVFMCLRAYTQPTYMHTYMDACIHT
jgi:hypothetical protein